MATILGIDIEPQVVRGVLVRTALRKSQVVRYVEAAVAPGASDEERTAALVEAVKQVTATFKPPAERVIAALPGDAASVRRVKLPAKAARRLEELLPFELESLVPFDPAESILDHQPIETVGAEMSLLATVVPKERVRHELERLSQLGVDARELAVGAVALDGLVGLVPALQTPGPHVLIGVTPGSTDICILRNRKCAFARTLSTGSTELNSGHQDLFVRELQRSLAAWRLEGEAEPAHYYLAGELAEREGADRWLSELLGVTIELLPLPAALGSDDGPRGRYVRAAALAGRGVERGKHLDLRQGDFAAKQAMTALRQHWALIAGCAGAIVVAFFFSSYARYSVLSSRNEELASQLSDVTRRELGTATTNPQQVTTLLARGVQSGDPMPRFDAYDTLAAISAAIPASIPHDVTQLEIDLGDGEETGRFSLRGTVTSIQEAEQVETGLRDYRIVRREGDQDVRYQCFREIQPGPTQRAGNDRMQYRLEGTLYCGPEGAPMPGAQQTKRGGTRRRTN